MEIVSMPPLPGDYNEDGSVDAADYVVWRKDENTNNALPNDNDLGTPIGPAHYDLWRSNFGTTSADGDSALTASAVPEPWSLTLGGWLLALLNAERVRTHRP
jgi:hypothetical protein